MFPGKGKRPHPNETSGSDLDGDVYFISWDINLIPNILDLSPPAEFPAHTTTNISGELQIRDFVSFFCRYNSRNNLGLIANAHKVWADISKKLANDPVCLRLAAEHSKEVDYAKTGVAGNLRESEKPKRYPDYMEKVGMHILLIYINFKYICQIEFKYTYEFIFLFYITPLLLILILNC